MPKNLIERVNVDELLFTAGNNPGRTFSVITALSREFDVSEQAVKEDLLNLGYHKEAI